MRKEIFRLKVRTWLVILATLAIGGLIGGTFFVRRQLAKYRPLHTFNVAAPEFFPSAHALADPVPLDGNRVTLLQNGGEAFPEMLKAIRAAKQSISFEAYIFSSDGTGRQFRDALAAQAKAGVRVRVLLDGLGSSTNLDNSDVQMMKDAGCEVDYYHATLSLRLDKMNRRSHRRVMVVDGRVGFTGGMGFSDSWSGNAEGPNHWRDTHMKIEGPLVGKLQGAFQQHWMKETEKVLSGAGEFPLLEPVGNLKAQLTATTSYTIASLPMTQAVAIAAAEKRIWITNAYCTPTEDQVYLLLEAIKRGVDVRILVPGKHNDQPLTKAAGRTAYGELLKGGVKIYEYVPTMVHQKTMVVDSLFAILGSSNLDARSSQLNEELDLTIYDAGFGKEMDANFEKDLAQSQLYTEAEFEKRGVWERFTEWLMLPFRSML